MSDFVSETVIKINDTEYKLEVTLKAAHALSRQFSGFLNAYQALGALNLEVACFIVRTGTDLRTAEGRRISTEALETDVWRHGVANLTGDLIKYVNLVESGGKKPEEENDGAGKPEGNTGNE